MSPGADLPLSAHADVESGLQGRGPPDGWRSSRPIRRSASRWTRTAIDLVDSSDAPADGHDQRERGWSRARTIAVRGTDAAGKSNVLCLRLAERTTGGLRVATDFPHPRSADEEPRDHPRRVGVDEDAARQEARASPPRGACCTTSWRSCRTTSTSACASTAIGTGRARRKRAPTPSSSRRSSRSIASRLLTIVDSKQPRGETPLVYSCCRRRPI